MAIKTARNPSTARDFNYASMAYNQHFYFDSLSPQTHSFPTDLAAHLSRSFSSLDTFKTTFLNTAAAMFGPGFVWLCLIRNPSEHHPNTDERRHPPSYKRDFETEAASRSAIDFRILPTYLAGSPFPGAHARQQSRDYNTTNIREVRAEAEAEHAAAQEGLTNTAGAFGRFAQNSISNPNAAIRTAAGLDNEPGMVSNVRFGGADVIPVLCVNVWEHAYVYDFGVGGKPGFLESWWERVDWEKVWRNCSAARESEVEEARSRSIGRRGTGGGRGRALLR
ncbi:MAG: hypothetical protein M1831_003868 [Alyxoria varia]|nr:MAG: hypothetical protein M1831_003868 [Alyxoria varia]